VTRLRVSAGGLAFEYLTWGPADGPLALCLHGYPDSAWTWRFLGPFLGARGWRVVAPWMRGYAPTSLAPDRDYSVRALAGDSVALHGALGGDSRAVLIGHDWGAVTAYAAAAAGVFSRLVTMAVAPMPVLLGVRDPLLIARQMRASWYMFFQQLPGVSERSLPRLIPRLWRDWSPGYDGADDSARALDALASPERRTAALRYYRALVQRRPQVLPLPRVPLLYLHGERDGCQLPEIARGAAGVLRGESRLAMVAGAGHFLHLERPEEVNALVGDFLGPA
jgi:pimeloyl-ACP methyl ester carboxylesterase